MVFHKFIVNLFGSCMCVYFSFLFDISGVWICSDFLCQNIWIMWLKGLDNTTFISWQHWSLPYKLDAYMLSSLVGMCVTTQLGRL